MLRELHWDSVSLAGVVEIEATPTGLRLFRLPHGACWQARDPMLDVTTAMAAGMRLCLHSDTRVLEVEADLAALQYAGSARRAITFDLHVDGRPFARQVVPGGGTRLVDFASSPPTIALQEAPAPRVTFDDLPAGMKRLELWLPHNAEVELRAVRVGQDASAAPLRERRPKWVHHGSSISHGKEVAGPADVWPALTAQRLGLDLTALGFSGQCMIDGFVARAIAQIDAAVISLELGINVVASDTMRSRTFRPAVHNFVDIIRDRHAATPILLMSPIVNPMLEAHPGPLVRGQGGFALLPRPDAMMVDALTASRVRAILHEVVERRRADGDAAIHYLDGLTLLGSGDAERLVDGLHPDEAGHRLMAARFAPLLSGLLP